MPKKICPNIADLTGTYADVTQMLGGGVFRKYDEANIKMNSAGINVLHSTYMLNHYRTKRPYSDKKFIKFVANVLRIASTDKLIQEDRASGDRIYQSPTCELLCSQLPVDLIDHERIESWIKHVKPRLWEPKSADDKPTKSADDKPMDPEKQKRMDEYAKLIEGFKRTRASDDQQPPLD